MEGLGVPARYECEGGTSNLRISADGERNPWTSGEGLNPLPH